MHIIDGKTISNTMREAVKDAVAKHVAAGHRAPGLAVIQVGHDPASAVYVRNKERACDKAGFVSQKFSFDEDVSAEELLACVEALNADPAIDGILCQLPLPKGLDDAILTDNIAPSKDVDAFHPENAGRLLLGQEAFYPCTAQAVVEILKRMDLTLSGKNVVVLGRSNIVGKPVAQLLLRENCTVTICHSRSKDLPEICKRADILVSAMGRAKMVGLAYTNPEQVVIDVAINVDDAGKLCGDIDYEAVKDQVKAITPVPGGVGPVTIAVLLQNCLRAYENHLEG